MTMDKYMKSEERQGKKIFHKLWDPLRFGQKNLDYLGKSDWFFV